MWWMLAVRILGVSVSSPELGTVYNRQRKLRGPRPASLSQNDYWISLSATRLSDTKLYTRLGTSNTSGNLVLTSQKGIITSLCCMALTVVLSASSSMCVVCSSKSMERTQIQNRKNEQWHQCTQRSQHNSW